MLTGIFNKKQGV